MRNAIDLLKPVEEFAENYKHQIHQTIEAYSVGHIAISEALQNALDAIARTDKVNKSISIDIDFDSSTVTVTDNGNGFPNTPKLLVLGGSDKGRSSRTVAGMVGVGIKVVLYCSTNFSIRSRTDDAQWSVDINDGHLYQEKNREYNIPTPFYADPESPLEETGTVVKYTFPEEENNSDWLLRKFMDHVKDMLVDPSLGADKGFPKTVKDSDINDKAAYLVGAYLSRFTYLGDTLQPLGGRNGFNGLNVSISLKCTNPEDMLGEFWSQLWGDNEVTRIVLTPGYLSVENTVDLRAVRKPTIFTDSLGHGGGNLDKTANGFNVTEYIDKDGYEKLIKNSRGLLPANHGRFDGLYEKINCIKLTIGRIPHFEEFLPQGSRRVLSANGVVTGHDIDITSGRNQQYVRCVDITMDLDAHLNYGKVHITNGPLVGLAKEFLNEAYRATLQNAASRFVGKIHTPDDDAPQDVFWAREDLAVNNINIPVTKKPYDENDVIALFTSLVSIGTLVDFKIFGFSQSDTYDSRMLAKRPSDRGDLMETAEENDLRTVEFKLHASQVVRDFESQIKDPRDIHLLICWDEGSWTNINNYELYGIEHSAFAQANPATTYPSVTDVIHDNRSDREMQVLILSKFLASLEDS